MIPKPDVAAVSAAIRETARREILPRFRELAEKDVWHKSRGSVVTVADTAAEQRLLEALAKIVPDARVIAEEAAEADPAMLDHLGGGHPLWIVDPLDGTANFAAGRTGFVVIVAFHAAGRVRAGWIHDPLNDITVTAEEGSGAWSGERRLSVARPVEVARMTGAMRGRLLRETDVEERFGRLFNHRSCGMEYMALATGEFHFSHYRSLKPWDHVAGELIHREAGGFSACLDGARYRAEAPGEGGLLLAPDEASWRAIADILRPAVASLQPR